MDILSFLLIGLLLGPAPVRAEDPPTEPTDIMSTFEKAWVVPKGYMRPLDDDGWKARMTAFQKLAAYGEKAIPALTDALAKGEPETRVFAAQALGPMAAPAAKPALEAARNDKSAAVRLYALDALSMFGKLAPTDELKAMKEKDANQDVKAHVGFALDRDDTPDPVALRKLLAGYDLAKMNTAVVGKAAPEFELTDATGKTYKLADFKGKKAVVLVFVYGDNGPVCHGQLAQLRDKIAEFEKRNVQLLAIDPHDRSRARPRTLDALALGSHPCQGRSLSSHAEIEVSGIFCTP